MAGESVGRIKTGTGTGTGAAINVSIGFLPNMVMVMNTTGNCFIVWTSDMGAAAGQKTVDSGAGTTDVSMLSSLGISQYTGSASASQGFTIGADTDINVNAETYYYVAFA